MKQVKKLGTYMQINFRLKKIDFFLKVKWKGNQDIALNFKYKLKKSFRFFIIIWYTTYVTTSCKKYVYVLQNKNVYLDIF